jgi:hypothetical protein
MSKGVKWALLPFWAPFKHGDLSCVVPVLPFQPLHFLPQFFHCFFSFEEPCIHELDHPTEGGCHGRQSGEKSGF